MADASEPPLTPGALRFWGLFMVLVGALIMLPAAGVLPTSSGDAPPLILACASLVFVLAGGLLVMRSFMGGDMGDSEEPRDAPFAMRAVYYAAGLGVVAMLATIGSWIAFGPGERAFSASLPFAGGGPANPWVGRAVFGVGAVLTWLFFIAAAVTWWRKLRAPSSS